MIASEKQKISLMFALKNSNEYKFKVFSIAFSKFDTVIYIAMNRLIDMISNHKSLSWHLVYKIGYFYAYVTPIDSQCNSIRLFILSSFLDEIIQS